MSGVTLQAVLAAVAAGIFVAQVMALLVPPRARLGPRVRPYTLGARTELGRAPDLAPATSSWGGLLRAGLARFVRRFGALFDGTTDEVIRRKLRQAGQADVRVEDYRIRQLAAGVASAVAGGIGGAALAGTALGAVFFSALGLVTGFTQWRARTDRAIQHRRERLRAELYTVNQLLALQLRSGGGPMQAVQRLVRRASGGAVIDDLAEIVRAVAGGVTPAAAFARAAELTPEPQAARTYRLLATGAERGADLGEALLSLSVDIRDARREEVKQAATRRRATMLVPIIGLLAPTMLLFIVAPLPSIIFGLR